MASKINTCLKQKMDMYKYKDTFKTETDESYDWSPGLSYQEESVGFTLNQELENPKISCTCIIKFIQGQNCLRFVCQGIWFAR